MKRPCTFRLSGIALALAAAFGPARAVEPIVGQNVEPRAPASLNTDASTASAGVGYTADNGRRFGQFNGINEDGFYGLLDFNWVRRDDATGTWTRIFGRDVGLSDRQLSFEQLRQGNWGYSIDYQRVPRFEPLIANTAVRGIGSSNLVEPPAFTPGGGATELKTKRDVWNLGLEKYFAGNWDVQLAFRNEEKEGTRIFGRGTTGTPAGTPVGSQGFCTCEFGPEPINATTRQLEAKVNYNGGALLLTGGYYGTIYNNSFDSGLNFTGSTSSVASFTPIALPPDNQSHQVYVSGNYAFSSTTRSTFKLAYGRLTQDAQFIVPPATSITATNLDGRIDTTLAQIGVTSRPIPKLSVVADLRYEDRDDKTPIRQYFTLSTPPPTTGTSNGENEPRSITTTSAKVEANYALPEGFRIIGGVAWDEKKRNVSAVRVVSTRETSEETTWRVELRRPMSETVTGSVAFLRSNRGGSDFLTTTVFTSGLPGSNLIAPIWLADRERDKVRVTVNWQPTNPLTVQLVADAARDNYEGRDPVLGPRNGEANNVSLDAAYVFSERWQANAWYARTDTSLNQTTCQSASGNPAVCPTTALTWSAAIRSLSNSFGVGMRGKPTGQIEFGFDFSYSEIKDENNLSAVQGTGTVTSLPEVTTKLTRLNLFGKYALQKNSGIRLDYIYDRFESNDWTWAGPAGGVPWVYADGTRLSEPPSQNVSFIGVSYYYKFQ